MASTYIAHAPEVLWSTATKVSLSLFNGAGSGVILRVRRIWVVNSQLTGVTGVLCPYTINRITTDTSGGTPTTITPVKYDTNNANLPAQVTCKTANTTNGTAILLKTMVFSSDEPVVGTFSMDELEVFYSLNCVWDIAYGNSTNEKPLTLNEGQGISIYQAAITSATGRAEFAIEFTT